jgi:hypothetical protein
MNENGKIHRPTSAPDQFDLLEIIFECLRKLFEFVEVGRSCSHDWFILMMVLNCLCVCFEDGRVHDNCY